MEKQPDNLEILFQDSMTAIPPRLQHRLKHIPKTQRIWDWAVILQIIFLTPMTIWGVIKLSPYLLTAVSFLGHLPIPVHGEATISHALPLDFAVGVIVTLFAVIYFALKDDRVWR